MSIDKETRRLIALIGVFVVFATGIKLVCTLGVTWDEAAYFSGGYRHVQWFAQLSPEAFSKASIDYHWGPNHEHPPAAKIVYGIAAFVTDKEDNPRLSLLYARVLAVAMFTALVGLVYLFTARAFGRIAGVSAAAVLPLMPRVLGHGSIAALDVPVAGACFASAILFLYSKDHKGRSVGAGAAWGVALLTKLNAVFVPLAVVPWAIVYWRKKAVRPVAIFLCVGGIMFFAGWPWLWPQPVQRTADYVLRRTEQVAEKSSDTGLSLVPVHYMGKTYKDRTAPWHYPVVMILVTLPAGFVVFTGAGLKRIRDEVESRPVIIFLAANAAVHVAVFCLPVVPKYDGIRLFMPAFPFIACLAGLGGGRVWTCWRRHAGAWAVCAVYVLTAGFCIWTFPYQLSFYNTLIGTARGAHELGFSTTYWGDAVHAGVQSRVNEVCRGSSLAVWPPAYNFWDRPPWISKHISYRAGWSPGDPLPDYLLLFRRQSYIDKDLRDIMREYSPIEEWCYMGVPQTELYAFPAR